MTYFKITALAIQYSGSRTDPILSYLYMISKINAQSSECTFLEKTNITKCMSDGRMLLIIKRKIAFTLDGELYTYTIFLSKMFEGGSKEFHISRHHAMNKEEKKTTEN